VALQSLVSNYVINYMQFADDIDLIADIEEHFQQLITASYNSYIVINSD